MARSVVNTVVRKILDRLSASVHEQIFLVNLEGFHDDLKCWVGLLLPCDNKVRTRDIKAITYLYPMLNGVLARFGPGR